LNIGERLAGQVVVIVRPQLSPVLGTSRFVKCRFESPVDLRRHLRIKEGFFLPGLAMAGEPGDRVIVEIAFPGEGDPPLLRGNIRSHQFGGTWLDLPYARVTSRWMAGPDFPRRRDRRVACDLFVEVESGGGSPWICRVIDVSRHGLRIAAAAMEVGVPGDFIDVTLVSPGNDFSSTPLTARVAWVGGHDAGLELHDNGGALLPILAAAEMRWRSAPEVVHKEAAEGCVCDAPLRITG